MQKSDAGNVHIFDLPEQIFRRIFSYLDENDIHSNLRKTCKKIEQFVHGYVKWENTVLLPFQNIDQGTPMELVQIIKYKHKRPHYYVKATYPDIPNRSLSRIRFAGIIRKQIVIGVDHCDYYRYGCCIQHELWYYSFEEHEWSRMCDQERMCQPRKTYTRADDDDKRSTDDDKRSLYAMWTQISESDIIVFHTKKLDNSNFIEILHFNEKEQDGRLTYTSCYCRVPEEICNLRNFCIVQRLESEILIVGGQREYWGPHGEHPQFVPNETVWSGILLKDNTGVSWKDSGHKIPFRGIGATGFCIDDSIYLAYFECDLSNYAYFKTNKTSIRYDWKTKNYHENVFPLWPEWLVYLGTCGHIVNVNEREKLVLLAARKER